MTGLQVWLHPSSRTKSVVSCQLSVVSKTEAPNAEGFTGYWILSTGYLLLNSPPFRRPATVMRNRCRVLNGPHFDSRRGQRAHRRFAPRSRTAHPHIHRAHPVIARHAGGVRRGLLRRKRSSFAGPTKTERARTLPRQHIAGHVRDGHDGVVERGLYVHQSVRDVLALLLFELLLLAFFLGRRGAACCCWFCHVFWFSVLGSQFSANPFSGSERGTAN